MPLVAQNNSRRNQVKGASVQNRIVFENNWWGPRCVSNESNRSGEWNISYYSAHLDAYMYFMQDSYCAVGNRG